MKISRGGVGQLADISDDVIPVKTSKDTQVIPVQDVEMG